MSNFYVGYLPKAPAPLARFLRRIIAGLGLLAVIVALTLVLGQKPFANASFEFGKVTSLEGVVEMRPYPALLVVRPGAARQGDKNSRYLLVAPGKHGADDLLASFDGKRVQLQGQLIYRDGGTMVEVAPGSAVVVSHIPEVAEALEDLGPVTLSGEIVDGKCYLGVMNPGQGKVHRDCAARCLSGGIPPIFVTQGRGEQILLVGPEGNAIGRDALREFVAEPLVVSGELLRKGDARLLRIDPNALRHAAKQN